MRPFWVAGLSALVASGASAELLSAAALKDYLEEAAAQRSFMKRTMAMGYISGVFDLIEGRDACPKNPIAASELMAVVRRHLETRPSPPDKPAAPLVVEALAERFPCRR